MIHAGPGVFKDALAHWHAEYPITAFPGPWKNIEVYEGIIGRERMRGPENFSRSFAEFMAGWAHADISYDKGDRLLEPSTNPRFDPAHFPSMSQHNLEPEDGNQQIIFHYIPFTECVRRQLSRRAFAGHQYFEYEEKECPRNPGARGYGRVNSGTWFEAAQMWANRLAAEAGHDSKCAVAGLVWVSDASFGGKSMLWHGVYGV